MSEKGDESVENVLEDGEVIDKEKLLENEEVSVNETSEQPHETENLNEITSEDQAMDDEEGDTVQEGGGVSEDGGDVSEAGGDVLEEGGDVSEEGGGMSEIETTEMRPAETVTDEETSHYTDDDKEELGDDQFHLTDELVSRSVC